MSSPKKNAASGLVYSTEHGRMCPDCGKPIGACVCRKSASSPTSAQGVVRVGRETAGRRGKGVTVITGLGLAPAQLEALCTQLKKKCGSGGTVKNGVIEIQGDHRDLLVAELTKLGRTVKRSGG